MSRLTSTFVTAWLFRAIAWLGIGWLLGWPGVLLLLAAAVTTQGVALLLRRLRETPAVSRALLGVSIAAHVALWGAVVGRTGGGAAPMLVPGMGVFACLAVSYLVDVYRLRADPGQHGPVLLYLLQFPVLPVGPLSRVHEFSQQLGRVDVTMAGFSYGVRRIVTGFTKVYLLAGPLGSTADAIFALRVTKLSTDTAWLGAVCGALEAYFYISGFSDIGIGLGKILGFRYQENFRRPFTADSIREFWRRWNVTLITWLRDYLSLPIAGHARQTVAGFLLTVAGFIVVGAWFRPSLNVLPWAVYFSAWLAVEAAGFGAWLQRLPRAVRHVYVLLVVLAGWTLLRASGAGPLLGYVEAMVGAAITPFGASSVYLTWDVTTALVCAVVFAGPMMGNVSRWRVSVDAATASLLMMLGATGVLLWHAGTLVRRLLPRDRPTGPPR